MTTLHSTTIPPEPEIINFTTWTPPNIPHNPDAPACECGSQDFTRYHNERWQRPENANTGQNSRWYGDVDYTDDIDISDWVCDQCGLLASAEVTQFMDTMTPAQY